MQRPHSGLLHAAAHHTGRATGAQGLPHVCAQGARQGEEGTRDGYVVFNVRCMSTGSIGFVGAHDVGIWHVGCANDVHNAGSV